MDVCLLCLYVVLYCVGRGLFDGLITRLEESYRASNYVLLRNLNTEEVKVKAVPQHTYGGAGGEEV
jgi:hypothetical protein